MIVCICHRISDRELVRHASTGMNFDAVQMETGVSTRCGQCESSARDIVANGCTMAQQMACQSYVNARQFSGSNARSVEWNTSQRSVPA